MQRTHRHLDTQAFGGSVSHPLGQRLVGRQPCQQRRTAHTYNGRSGQHTTGPARQPLRGFGLHQKGHNRQAYPIGLHPGVGQRRKRQTTYGSPPIVVHLPTTLTPMSIWKKPISLESLNASSRGTAMEHLGIEFTEFGDDFLRGRVPVDHRTVQPFGLLHGGVSVVLAESLGSVGAMFACPEGHRGVGLDINANHLRGATSGWVTGTARAVHIGRTTHVWQIDMVNDAGELTCVSRITMAILASR